MPHYIKPPLGVKPKKIWKIERIQELCRAIYERSTYEIDDIMKDWASELLELLESEVEKG